MKVSYKWLQEYLDIDVKPTDLAEKLARTSVDINDVYSPSDGLTKLVVGFVTSTKPHPDSDHLTICQVNIGETEDVQIVCGAPNIAANQNVIVALPGSRIGNNIKIKRSKMRGELSEGMICALQEIGFSEKVSPKDYEDGIWVLPEDAKPGESIFPYLGMDDVIIDTDITPNRGDMFSIRGNVNDIAAFYNLKSRFEVKQVVENSSEKTADLISAAVDNTAIAPTYKLRVIKDIQIAESPLWLQIKLWNAGIRPINNVVDVTNYILVKYGQPLHSFDYDKLPSHEISVRHANDGEQFVTLDDETRELISNDIVVTAGDKPVALAGTMGGLETAISAQTTNVTLEAAIFDSILVRKQARRLDLHSESSTRFERGIDPAAVEMALDEAAQMIAELANGEVTTGIVTGSETEIKEVKVDITLTRINHVLGTSLTVKDVLDIFKRLAFETKVTDDKFTVKVPSRRWDVNIEADLLEEIARIFGYDNIPSTLPSQTSNVGRLNDEQKLIRSSRHVLEGLGLNQAISYSLTTPEKAQQFQIIDGGSPMTLSYPMSQDHVATRMNLISGLLNDVAYNVARTQDNVALYEQGRTFVPVIDNARPTEEEHIAGAVTGKLVSETWHDKTAAVDFYQVKGIVEQLIQNMAIKGTIEFVANSERKEMHPGRTADIKLNHVVIGVVGQVHPKTAKAYKIPETYVFELNLTPIIAADKNERHYQEISKYPSISRDIAMLVDENISNQQIVDLIENKGGAYLTDVTLFDFYQGSHVPEGQKSLAYSLTYQDKNDTLVEDKVNQAFDKVIAKLVEEFEITVR